VPPEYAASVGTSTFGKKAAPPLSERQADFGLGYGLYWLENGGDGGFRWSRRFFGFYLDLEGPAQIELDFESTLETTLTFFSDGREVAAITVQPGRQSATFQIPPASRRHKVWHAGFMLGDTWRPDGDPRTLGLKWFGLRVCTETEIVRYGADAFSHNGSKHDWLALDDYFQLQGNTARDLRRNARLNVKERKAETQQVVSTPLRLYMELAWLCNIRCPSCFQAYVPNNLRKEAIHFMSPHVFREAAEKLFPGAAMVWYSGNGETLLHPNIDTILRTARDFKFVPALLTNGTLFTEHNMRLLVEGGFFLSISIDSPYEKDFERLRAGARFSKLVGALEHLRTLQRQVRNKRFHIRVQCVAQQSNLDQLVDLVKWAASYDAREIQFLPIHNFGDHAQYIEQAKLHHTPDRVNREMLEAVRTGTKLGVRVRPVPPLNPSSSLSREYQAATDENIYVTRRLDDIYDLALNMPEHPANNADGRCSLAWSECFICADGKVAPCCIDLTQTTVGNLYDDDFWTIWNGSRMTAWRQTVNRDPSGICSFGTCVFRRASPADKREPSRKLSYRLRHWIRSYSH
jgi:MoaA/NifB/PqqE/SkfB family radical SAM enzyme